MGSINPMQAEGSHSNNNNNDEIVKTALLHLATILSILTQVKDLLKREGTIQCIGNSPINNTPAVDASGDKNACDKNEKKHKGFLAANYTIADKLVGLCCPLFLLSLSYPLTAEAQLSFEDTWMQIICIGTFSASVSSYILSFLTSYLKESESVHDYGFVVFKWLLLSVLLLLYAVLCMILRFFAHTSNLVLWPLGIIGSCSIVLAWFRVFYKEWPKVMQNMKNTNVRENKMLSDRADSEPSLPKDSDRYLKNWPKAVYEKMQSCLGLKCPTTSLPGPNADLSVEPGICTVEVR